MIKTARPSGILIISLGKVDRKRLEREGHFCRQFEVIEKSMMIHRYLLRLSAAVLFVCILGACCAADNDDTVGKEEVQIKEKTKPTHSKRVFGKAIKTQF